MEGYAAVEFSYFASVGFVCQRTSGVPETTLIEQGACGNFRG